MRTNLLNNTVVAVGLAFIIGGVTLAMHVSHSTAAVAGVPSASGHSLNPVDFDPQAQVMARYAEISDVIAAQEAADTACASKPYDQTSPACRDRDKLSDRLASNGYCYSSARGWYLCARPMSPTVKETAAGRLESRWADLNEQCRGGSGDDPRTMRACDEREKVDVQLTQAGWCYGSLSEARANLSMADRTVGWHPCGPDSCRRDSGC